MTEAEKKPRARWAVPERPALAAAIAAGLLRGLVGGLLPALVCLALFPNARGLVIAVGIPLGATCLTLAEELAPLVPEVRNGVLALGGLVAPTAVALPWISALGFWLHLRPKLVPRGDELSVLLGAILLGVFVGAAVGVADRAVKSTTRWAHFKRLALAALGLGLVTSLLPITFWVFDQSAGRAGRFPYDAVLAGLSFVPIALLLGVGSAGTHGLAERARGWVEPRE